MEESKWRGSAAHCRGCIVLPWVSLTLGGSLGTTGLHVAITYLECREGTWAREGQQAEGRESITRVLSVPPTVPTFSTSLTKGCKEPKACR